MTTAAIPTMATVDAATIMAGITRTCPCRPQVTPFVPLRLHARPQLAFGRAAAPLAGMEVFLAAQNAINHL
jgi:hypothetical protein